MAGLPFPPAGGVCPLALRAESAAASPRARFLPEWSSYLSERAVLKNPPPKLVPEFRPRISSRIPSRIPSLNPHPGGLRWRIIKRLFYSK